MGGQDAGPPRIPSLKAARRLPLAPGQRLQLEPDVLDLVAQLGGVLEAELLGGGEHLLLQFDRQLLQLLATQALYLGGTAAALAGHVRLLEREELGDIRDALDDLHRLRPVLRVVSNLDDATAIGFLDCELDRLGHLVAVENHLAADAAGAAPDRLDQRCLPAQEALLVGVEDRDQRHLGQIEPLAQEVDADQYVVLAEA